MQASSSDMLETGYRAMAAGNRSGAAAAFRQITDPAITGTIPWMALAQACYEAGDVAGEEDALSARIRAVRSDIDAILAMAETKRSANDPRAAVTFYKLALATAAQMPSVPQYLHEGLSRAEQFCTAIDRDMAAHLFEKLDQLGVRTVDAPPRVAHALRLLSGEVPLFLQQPSMFYFPGLAQRGWWDAAEFGWTAELEATTAAISVELETLLAAPQSPFAPYVQASPDRPPPNNPLLDNPDWGAAWLLKNGVVADGMAAACPATLAALALAPQPIIPNRAPLALFSRLKPGTHILPHHGMLNTRLICHLPLIVPDGCALRVGSETRAWQPGRLTIFDDSFEHEAWNRGASDRTILLFEIWRPDLSEDECAMLTRIFAAIDDYDVN